MSMHPDFPTTRRGRNRNKSADRENTTDIVGNLAKLLRLAFLECSQLDRNYVLTFLRSGPIINQYLEDPTVCEDFGPIND